MRSGINERAKMVCVAEIRPVRPRKWANNAERMRAYRAVERERREALRGQYDISEMAERVVTVTAERDRLWQQVRPQQRIAQLEKRSWAIRWMPLPRRARPAASVGMSRAERRRLEREQQRRR